MTVALSFAVALGIVELYNHGIRPLRNKWLLILIVYIPVSILLAPTPQILLVGIDVSSFWAWRPLVQILTFFFMAAAVASHTFTRREVKYVFETIAWCGLLTSVYVIAQRFGMDQFFKHTTSDKVGAYAGFIGNPTLTAPFVAMTIPFMLLLRRWWMLPIAALGIVFPDSQMAYGGLVAGLLFWFGAKGKKRFVFSVVTATLLFLGLVFGYASSEKIRSIVVDHERFSAWTQIARDIKDPISPEIENAYPLTGRGLGSFRFIFHIQHPGTEEAPNRFHQAHNEYLEFAYNTGLIGLALLLLAMYTMAKETFSIYSVFVSGEDQTRTAILSSFIVIAVVACGTFIWQVGTTAFYSSLLIGLMHNSDFQKRRFV